MFNPLLHELVAREQLNDRLRQAEQRRFHSQLLSVRPVTPNDTALLADLISHLSDTARWMRYFRPLPSAELIWQEVSQVTRREPQLGVALVATASEGSRVCAIALAELAHDPTEPAAAEVALLVRDDAQRKGVGTLLLREIIALARQRDVRTLHATLQAENWAARQLLRKLALAYHAEIHNGELSIWAELP
ncbi:MAG TPA: GNAT family N-acetyltransferase [Burkholderiales bacterium]|nr:GNAT family N-acetyltransferase [Burkholderiales bacterium]